ncbi:hypothetical protein TNCV_1381501 [Trichonephila clavipes]|nr:hypothetical protein TNCV_1381501 [Trichonephila clavipes]
MPAMIRYLDHWATETSIYEREREKSLPTTKAHRVVVVINATCLTKGRKPWGWSGASHLYSTSTNHTRGLAARRLFRVPPYRKGTIHLQTSMSSPGFEPSPYGIAVSVANH